MTSDVIEVKTLQRLGTLGIVRQLLERLHSERIMYCHWKSNNTLEGSLLGMIDLDLLVDPTASSALTKALSDVGFKPLVATPCLAHPAIHSFLGLDRSTGSLAHVHVYYRLITGEGHLKGYHLPWERVVLSTRRVDPRSGAYVADPNVEALLYMVRVALRWRAMDRLFVLMGWSGVRQSTIREFQWLHERVDMVRLTALCQCLLGQDTGRRLIAAFEDFPSTRSLVAFRKHLVTTLHPHRRFGAIAAVWHRWLREFCWLRGKLSLEVLRTSVSFTRMPATGGLLVAFIGVDGSGKSSLVKKVVAWLAWKVDVSPMYFGSGDGPASVLRWPLQVLARALRPRSRRRARAYGAANAGSRRDEALWEALGRVIWALTLSYEKRRKLRWAWHAHERGMVVVCDRFPQNQVNGFMDGPLLSHWLGHRLWWLRVLARWERVPYDWAEAHPPDLVVHLDVSPEVAHRRKPDMSLDDIRRRANAVQTLRFSPQTHLAVVEAERSPDEVLLAVKTLIWNVL